MAETEQPIQLPLGDFLTQAAEALEKELQPGQLETIWATAETYPEEGLLTILENLKPRLATDAPNVLAAELKGEFTSLQQRLSQGVKTGVKPSPAAAAAALPRAEYIHDVRVKLVDKKNEQARAFAQEFAPKLVQNFIAQTRQQLTNQQQQELTTKIQDHVIGAVAKRAAIAAEIAPILGAQPQEIEPFIKTEQPTVARALRTQEALDTAASIAVKESVPKPNTLFAIAVQLAQASDAPVATIVTKSASLTRAAVAATVDAPTIGTVAATGKFFQSVAHGPAAEFIAPFADIALDVVGSLNPAVREAFVERVLDSGASRAVQNIEHTVAALTQRMGETAARSEAVAQAIHSWRVSADQQKTAAQAAVSGVQNIVSDMTGAFFGIDEASLAYFELVHLNQLEGKAVPSRGQFYAMAAYPQHPDLFHFEFLGDLAGWGLRMGGTKAAGKALEAGAKKAGGGLLAGWLAKLGLGKVAGGAAGGLLGGPIGAIAGGLLTSVIGGALKLGGRALSGAWLTNLITGAGSGKKEGGFWLALGAVIVVAVFALGPLLGFLPGLGITQLATDTPLATSIGGGVATGGQLACDSSTNPYCQLTACDPATEDCRWPTSCGCITQGPFAGITHGKHEDSLGRDLPPLNAIDVGFGGCNQKANVTVRATHRGRVSFVYDRLAIGDKNTILGGYGNRALVTALGPGGEELGWTLLYGHLATIEVVAGQEVTVGDIIGTSDDNGVSFGEHLHYEIKGYPGNISTLLPEPGRVGVCWGN